MLQRLSLRSKSVLAMVLATVLVLLPASAVGWRAVLAVQEFFADAYARNLTELSRQTILAPVLRDLALSQRLAESLLVREWLLDEPDGTKAARAFEEAAGFQRAFQSGAYFIISALSLNYYFNELGEPLQKEPRYTLDQATPTDAWFFRLLESDADFNLNVNPDAQLQTTRVWINVPIREQGETIGFAGTGVDLTQFIERFLTVDEPGVTPIIIDPDGAIQAHPDRERIAFGSSLGLDEPGRSLFDGLTRDDQANLRAALSAASTEEADVVLVQLTLDGHEQRIALIYLPELQWFLLTAVDLGLVQILSPWWWLGILAGLLVLVLLLLFAMTLAVERVLIAPLNRLQGSALAIAKGDYQVTLPPPSRDEIGNLIRAFIKMTTTIRQHTEELEAKVQARTEDLAARNREIVRYNEMLNDSINYASLIQRAILPDAALRTRLGAQFFVLWRPRDTVGGDFYLFHDEGDQYLLGLIDCAGHGVPGALMTMLARAAFDHAIRDQGLRSPAVLLMHTDAVLRSMLQDLDLPPALATTMDASVVIFSRSSRQLLYAGAKQSLFVRVAGDIIVVKGQRTSLLARKPGVFSDTPFSLEGNPTFYLTTDGFLDQAGGEQGYGMGNRGFIAALAEMEGLPLAAQGGALWERIQNYMGEYRQRDDIAVVGFSPPSGS